MNQWLRFVEKTASFATVLRIIRWFCCNGDAKAVGAWGQPEFPALDPQKNEQADFVDMIPKKP